MAILFGLLAALGWGVGDFLSRFAVRGMGAWRGMFYGQVPGLIAVSAWMAMDDRIWPRLATAVWWVWPLAVAACACSLAATYALMRGIMVGTLSLIVPIAASYGAICTVLSLLTGERLEFWPLSGIAACVLGIATAAAARAPHQRIDPPPHASGAGIGWALCAAAGFGTAVWLQGLFTVPRLGPAPVIWIAYALNVVVALFFVVRGRLSLRPPLNQVLMCSLGAGALTAGAYIAMMIGLTTGRIAVVAVISSLCSTLTSIMGVVLLKERMSLRQWAGVGLILCGVLLVNTE